jgi:hypothetical protein
MAVAMLIGIAPLAQAMTYNERMAELSKKMETVVDAKTSRRLQNLCRWRKTQWRKTTKAAA